MVDRGVLDSNGVLPLTIHTSTNERFLPPHFKPGNWDVICHNGKSNKLHIGNMRFKVCIGNYLRSYTKASTRSGKSAVLTDIVTSIRDCSNTGGGFVRFDSSLNRWYEVGDKVARDKVGQALRDTLRNQQSIKDVMARASTPVISVPRKKREGIVVSELEKNSNLTSVPPDNPVTQVPKGFDTGALPTMATVAEHSGSLTPLTKTSSTVTLDSCSDSLVGRTCNNDFESRIDHCFTCPSTGTCTHNNPYMDYEDNVAVWFEYDMASG